MLTADETFEQTRTYMTTLVNAVDRAPKNFGDDAFLNQLGISSSEACQRFCNLEVHSIPQVVAQLRVAIGDDDIDDTGITGVSIRRLLDRVEELAGSAARPTEIAATLPLTFDEADREYSKRRALAGYLDLIASESDANQSRYDAAVAAEESARQRLLAIKPTTAEQAMRQIYVKAKTEPNLSAYEMMRDIEDAQQMVYDLSAELWAARNP